MVKFNLKNAMSKNDIVDMIDNLEFFNFSDDDGLFSFEDIKNWHFGVNFKWLFDKLIDKVTFSFNTLKTHIENRSVFLNIDYSYGYTFWDQNDNITIDYYDYMLNIDDRQDAKLQKDIKFFNGYLEKKLRKNIDFNFKVYYDFLDVLKYDKDDNLIGYTLPEESKNDDAIDQLIEVINNNYCYD